MSRRPAGLIVLALIVVAWNTALLAAPRTASPRVSALVYAAGSVICHQRADRSFHVDGAQYPVCARCLGLYLGAFVGLLPWLAVVGRRGRGRRVGEVSPATLRRVLVLAALPTLATVVTASVGWWDPSNGVRAGLSIPFGAAIMAIVAAFASGDLR